MATLSVLIFDSEDGAEQALCTVRSLGKRLLITLQDVAIAIWDRDQKKPKTWRLADVTSAGALNGAFWGMLLGWIFFVPFVGAAVRTASGAMVGVLSGVGIDKDFIEQVRAGVTEGTSCLFLMTSDATEGQVAEAMRQHSFEIISTHFSKEHEKALQKSFCNEA